MKRKEENRTVIEPSCTFLKQNKITCLPSNRVLDRKPDRVTGYNRFDITNNNIKLVNLPILFFKGMLAETQLLFSLA
jgi:hypothetical protein